MTDLEKNPGNGDDPDAGTDPKPGRKPKAGRASKAGSVRVDKAPKTSAATLESQQRMRTFIGDSSFPFMSWRRPALWFSGVLLVIAIVAILVRGLNFGVDFTGGYSIEVGYASAPVLQDIRDAMVDAGVADSQVQTFGTSTDILIRIPPGDGQSDAAVSDTVLSALAPTSEAPITMRRVEFVGPQVGEELREKGGLAILIALFGIVVYVWFRFEKKFSVGSVAALIHDVVITVGVFALFGIEFDLTVLAAILAIIGYSLNDTIVVFDRLRENFLTLRRGTPEEIIDISINQTLTRTLITSGTTLMVVLALYVLGGEIISGFALALLIGIGFGTYSSVYVASLFVFLLGITKQDMMPVEKEGADLEPVP